MNEENKQPNKVLKWSLIIGIVIVLNLFYNFSLSLILAEPNYENFCPQEQVVNVPDNQQECVDKGGSWTNNPKPVRIGEVIGYCDITYSCNKKFQEANKDYTKNIFVALVVLGVATFVASLFFAGQELVATALALGAVLDFVVASTRYWAYAEGWLRVVILGMALVALIWIGVKKFNK